MRCITRTVSLIPFPRPTPYRLPEACPPASRLPSSIFSSSVTRCTPPRCTPPSDPQSPTPPRRGKPTGKPRQMPSTASRAAPRWTLLRQCPPIPSASSVKSVACRIGRVGQYAVSYSPRSSSTQLILPQEQRRAGKRGDDSS
jgi:hypothetical protein